MSLKNRIKSAVDIAFQKLDDLSYNVTFASKSVSDFDFATGSIVESNATYTTKGFLETKTTSVEGNLATRVTLTTLTIKTIPDIDVNRYSEVTVNSTIYRCSVISQDEFITILSLARV